MAELNYSPLTEPLSPADNAAYRDAFRQAVLTWYKRNGPTVATTLFFVMLVGFGFVVRDSQGRPFALPVAVLFLGALIFMGAYGYRAWQASARMWVQLEKFAQANGLKTRYADLPAGYSGMIFNQPQGLITTAVTFPDGAEIGNFSFITGSGRSRHVVEYGYMRLGLGRRLPHMVLDAKGNNTFGITNLITTFDRSQTIALEGDFNTAYTLYAPKEYETDARYVFTPDVMASLLDYGDGLDMEIVDDQLYVYHSKFFNLASETELRSLLRITDTFGSELRSQTARYADDRAGAANPIAATTAGQPVQNAVAPEGRRLKAMPITAASGGFILLIVVIQFAHVFSNNPPLMVIVPFVLFLVFTIYMTFKYNNKR